MRLPHNYSLKAESPQKAFSLSEIPVGMEIENQLIISDEIRWEQEEIKHKHLSTCLTKLKH